MSNTAKAIPGSTARNYERRFARIGLLLGISGIALHVLEMSTQWLPQLMSILSGVLLIASALAIHKAGTFRMSYAKGSVVYLIISLIFLGIGVYWLIA